MKKASILAAALVAAVAIAQPIARIVDGTVAAGASSSFNLGNVQNSNEGTLGAVLFHTSTANPTGVVSILHTRGGLYTNAVIYSAGLTNQQTSVGFLQGGLGLLSTDVLTVTNNTGDSVTYSVTVTK